MLKKIGMILRVIRSMFFLHYQVLGRVKVGPAAKRAAAPPWRKPISDEHTCAHDTKRKEEAWGKGLHIQCST